MKNIPKRGAKRKPPTNKNFSNFLGRESMSRGERKKKQKVRVSVRRVRKVREEE